MTGKNSGFMATGTSLISGDVNICLIPEISFQVNGVDGLFESICQITKTKGNCIVVLTEGTGAGLIEEERA
jgi:6-phosphofructokinase 1